MTTATFQNRSDAAYGTAITKFNSSECDDETRMLYLVGRRPDKYHEQYKDTDGWNRFLQSKGLSPETPVETQVMAASAELAGRIMDDDMISRICDEIKTKIENNPDRQFTSVRITCPYPIDSKATTNTFAPALAAAVSEAIETNLADYLQAHGIQAKPDVVAELDPEKSSRQESILNLVDNDRGATSNPEPGKEVDLYMQRLFRQAVYSGPVDSDAIYVPVDDFLVSQSTMTGLMNYIQANDGVTTPAVTGFKLFNGLDVLEPRQATLDLLNTAIESKRHEVNAIGGKEAFQRQINNLLNQTGLHIDFDDVSKTNLSNAELLFVAGYFADGNNPRHQEAFAKALTDIGSSVKEAKGNSAYDIFNSPAGSIEGLKQICNDTLGHRELMQSPVTSQRLQQLAQKGGAAIIQEQHDDGNFQERSRKNPGIMAGSGRGHPKIMESEVQAVRLF